MFDWVQRRPCSPLISPAQTVAVYPPAAAEQHDAEQATAAAAAADNTDTPPVAWADVVFCPMGSMQCKAKTTLKNSGNVNSKTSQKTGVGDLSYVDDYGDIKSWRSKFEKKNTSVEVNGCVDYTLVAEKFADHFSKAYTCNNVNRAVELDKEYVKLRVVYHGSPFTSSFDLETVSHTVDNLKLGKAPDLENLSAEHLKYCHPILSCILTKLFNLILYSGEVPSAFSYSYTVPLSKLQDTRTKAVTADDFRGIAISRIQPCYL